MRNQSSLFAFVVSVILVVAPPTWGKNAQTTVSSADQTLTYGANFTPVYSGGSGTGNWQFCIGGITGFDPTYTAGAGTKLQDNTWTTSWNRPDAGSYGFYIVKCGDNDYDTSNYAGWYNLTVNRAYQPTVSSAAQTITYGQSFSPANYYGGAGTGAWQFCIGGYTDFAPSYNGPGGTRLFSGQWVSAWPNPDAGSYSFYVVKCGDNNWENSNYSSPYSLTVNRASQPTVSSANQTINEGQAFTPAYYGGAGNGNWQFCIGGITGFAPSYNGPGGTLKDGQWSGSWTPPGPGTYGFYIVKCGDNNWENSNYAGWYWLTVNDTTAPSTPGGLQASGITSNSFVLSWSASSDNVGVTAYEVRRDSTSLGTTSNTSMTISGLSPNTTYQMTVRARDAAGNWSGWSGALAVTTASGQTAPSFTTQPSTQTVTSGGNATFTVAASGNPTPSYQWQRKPAGGSFSNLSNGGNYSGTTSSQLTVTGTTTAMSGDQFQCVASNSAGSATSNAATLTVNPPPVSPPVVTGGNTGGTVGVAFSYNISASNGPTSYGASPLPPGLNINTSTGQIYGTPTTAGTTNVTLSATNAGGTGTATLTITISSAPADNQLNVHLPVTP